MTGEPGSVLTLDLFGEDLEPTPGPVADDAVQAASAKGSRATPARGAQRTKAAAEPVEAAASAGGEPHDPGDPGDRMEAGASPQPEATDAQKRAEPSADPVPDLQSAAAEPAAVPLPASGVSCAATSATGNAARMISAVHAADVDAAVHGFAPEQAASPGGERAMAGLPTEIVAAMAAQTRRTKWMLTAAVTALVVTAGVAIAQTLLLASLSADTAAQQQRFDLLMQNQQAALDSVAARLAAPAAAAPVALAAVAPVPATTAMSATREQTGATPSRHVARAARTPKSSEKPAPHAAGTRSSRTRSQHSTHQKAAKS
ncbi:MAG TPA: hypothetical protein VJS30_20245 [Paraburkholderia sp.]|nr:hypothetical protein [Paraburkholderia sp.]